LIVGERGSASPRSDEKLSLGSLGGTSPAKK